MGERRKAVSQFTKPNDKDSGEEGIHVGRAKGKRNRQTETFTDIVLKFRDRKIGKAFKAWEEIQDPKDKVKTFLDLVYLVTPKPQSVNMDADADSAGYADVLKRLRQEAEAAEERRDM